MRGGLHGAFFEASGSFRSVTHPAPRGAGRWGPETNESPAQTGDSWLRSGIAEPLGFRRVEKHGQRRKRAQHIAHSGHVINVRVREDQQLRRETEFLNSIQKRLGFEAIGAAGEIDGHTDILRSVQTEDLLKFGLIPEFVGRFPVLTTLADLDVPALIRVLTEPRNALVRHYQALLEIY